MNIFDKTDILLPDSVNMEKWSVVACDQYSSQPEYWERVAEFVGDSHLHLTLCTPKHFCPRVMEELKRLTQKCRSILIKRF